jgi:class 3 adenylate cyclase
VPTCVECGRENPDEARFCLACGARLEEAPALRELRKTVTVLFSDVTGSTAIGERLDPEPLRGLMLRFYEAMKEVCERHGGRVSELIGDAVMAAFGIPSVHEDDALRAVRASAEMHERLEALNEELERDFGVRLRARTGVNTGEVVVRDRDSDRALVLGDAVNVAAGLEQAAEPGEVLLGESTYMLVRDAVRAEHVEPLSLKGKSEPVSAFRLLDVLPDVSGFARRFEIPLVGREDEVLLLRKTFERSVRDRRGCLVTVFGPAGIGKTRLAKELGASVAGEATVLTGRCLSYGDGITYWPIREMVVEAAGERPLAELLAGEDDADAVASRVAAAIGVAENGGLAEEIFWAIRKLFEVLALRKPLVLVFEDLHWAEPTLLDLVEHVPDSSRQAPILLLCLARPELLDKRPTWGGGKLNASSMLIGPLSEAEREMLLAGLAGEGAVSESTRGRISKASQGNPLFLEQMVAMLVEEGEGDRELPVPPAIQALLAARLDLLDPEERRIIECGAVEGELFHSGAIGALSTPERVATVGVHLASLVRKELLVPDRATISGEKAFRFRHALIREAAYGALPKERRAELHELFAGWLEDASRERPGELEELLGYHLEQAYRYRAGLGSVHGEASGLAERARLRLLSAGRRAFRRGDMLAAINLLERARSLPADEKAWLEFAPDLGFALFQAGQLERAEAVFSCAIECAKAVGDRHAERHASLLLDQWRLFNQPDRFDFAETLGETEASLVVFEEEGDDLALTRVWILLWNLYQCTGEAPALRNAAERALEHARRAGSRLDEAWSLNVLGWSLVDGPTPVAEGVRVCHDLLDGLGSDRLGDAIVSASLANLVAMQGRFEDARALIVRSRAAVQELGMGTLRTVVELMSGRVETLAEDPQAAERATRTAAEHSAEIVDNWYYLLASMDLAQAVCEQDRPAECLHILDESELRPSPPDWDIVVMRPATRALALGRLGRLEEAEPLAREAVGYADGTQFLGYHADALIVLAEVLRLAGRPAEAASTLEAAARLFDLKGDVVSAAKTHTMLQELAAPERETGRRS